VGQSFGEDGGQRRECTVSADSDTRNSAIGEDENGGDGIDVPLNLSCDNVIVQLVLLSTASVGQPRRVENTNLGRRSSLAIRNTNAYHYAVVAPKLVKMC